MKGRLITNGILALAILIVNIFSFFGSNWTLAIGLLIMLHIASLVMGIVTLSMEKHEAARGLTIASGVLAILGGVLGSNAIVSFIGAHKISLSKKLESKGDTDQPPN